MVEQSADDFKRQLQQMDPYRFEKLVAALWESEGFETTVRSGSRDRGVDVVATKDFPYDQKLLIQAKRYTEGNKVGSQDVRNYATLYQQEENADTVIIATTSTLTSEAQRLATDLNVKTVDVEYLTQQLRENDDIRRKFGFEPTRDSDDTPAVDEERQTTTPTDTESATRSVDWGRIERMIGEYTTPILENDPGRSLKITWKTEGNHKTVRIAKTMSGWIFKTEAINIRILPEVSNAVLSELPGLSDFERKNNSIYADVDAESARGLAYLLTKLVKQIGIDSTDSLELALRKGETFSR